MLCAAWLTLFLLAVSSFANKDKPSRARSLKDDFTSRGQFTVPVSNKDLREDALHSRESTFHHTTQLLEALKLGKSKFEVLESVHNAPDWNLANYNELSSIGFYDTNTTYALAAGADSFLVLDHVVSTASLSSSPHVRTISDGHVELCGEQQHFPQGVGAFIVGSHDGAWFREMHVQAYFEKRVAELHPLAKAERLQGLVLVRKVLSVTKRPTVPVDAAAVDTAHVCHHVETETLHPLELLDTMRMETVMEHPIQTTYTNIDAQSSPAAEKRTLEQEHLTYYAQPDAGIMKCSDTRWMDDDNWGFHGYAISENYDFFGHGNGYYYELGAFVGCAQINLALPGSFNLNYDTNTRNAKNQYSLGNGITCSNCYAFMGAGFMAIVNYGSGGGNGYGGDGQFHFEAKVAGGAGYNVNIDVSNPSFSGGSSLKTLIPSAGITSYISLGAGFSLSYGLGGLAALLSGTGSATGSASFGAGTSFTASLAVRVDGGSISMPMSSTYTNIPPFFNSGGMSINSMNVGIDLAGKELFKLSYGSILAGNFHADLTGSMSFSYGSSSNAVAHVSAPITSRSSLRSRSLGAVAAKAVYSAGDEMEIVFSYTKFPVSEETHLFYSIVLPNGESRSFLEKAFVTSATGNGSFAASFVVPWNSAYAGSGSEEFYINVAASNKIDDVFSTSPFSFSLFTETDGIFFTPASGQFVPVNEPFDVTWNASLLTYFKSDFLVRKKGSRALSVNVTMEMVGEKVSDQGVVTETNHIRLFNDSVPNSGHAVVTFHESFASLGDRFYLIVRSTAFNNIQGWSPAYFALSSRAAPQIHTMAAPSNKLREHANNLQSRRLVDSVVSTYRPHQSRILSSCPGQGQVTTQATTDGGLDSISIFSFFTLGASMSTGSIMLKSPESNCVAVPVAQPTFNPSARPSPAPLPSIGNQLTSGSSASTLPFGKQILSASGAYVFKITSVGNLCGFAVNDANEEKNPFWCASLFQAVGTFSPTGSYLTLQSDGNLVYYSSTGSALWASEYGSMTYKTTSGPFFFIMQDDRNFVVYAVGQSSNTPIWASGQMSCPAGFSCPSGSYINNGCSSCIVCAVGTASAAVNNYGSCPACSSGMQALSTGMTACNLAPSPQPTTKPTMAPTRPTLKPSPSPTAPSPRPTPYPSPSSNAAYFFQYGGDGTCPSSYFCGEGFFLNADCSLCLPCKPNTYSDAVTFVDATPYLACPSCPDTYVAPAYGSTTCSPTCPGSYSCTPGMYLGATCTSCNPCPVGTASAVTAYLSCPACAPGMQALNVGSTACTATDAPTVRPSPAPSAKPTTSSPTTPPTPNPTTRFPTPEPTVKPSPSPSPQPTIKSTIAPTRPTSKPTLAPTVLTPMPTTAAPVSTAYPSPGSSYSYYYATGDGTCPSGYSCEAGYFLSEDCSMCEPCTPNTYSDAVTFVDATPYLACPSCPDTYVAPAFGSTTCSPTCPGSYSCSSPGTYMDANCEKCYLCDVGTASAVTAYLSCPACAPGMQALNVGSTACTATDAPTVRPTSAAPTVRPSPEPSAKPTTSSPTFRPTPSPTSRPSPLPSLEPTPRPSPSPSQQPSVRPSPSPSVRPSPSPTSVPTVKPTVEPTVKPSPRPTPSPSVRPSPSPSSAKPIPAPTVKPSTGKPTAKATTGTPHMRVLMSTQDYDKDKKSLRG